MHQNFIPVAVESDSAKCTYGRRKTSCVSRLNCKIHFEPQRLFDVFLKYFSETNLFETKKKHFLIPFSEEPNTRQKIEKIQQEAVK